MVDVVEINLVFSWFLSIFISGELTSFCSVRMFFPLNSAASFALPIVSVLLCYSVLTLYSDIFEQLSSLNLGI